MCVLWPGSCGRGAWGPRRLKQFSGVGGLRPGAWGLGACGPEYEHFQPRNATNNDYGDTFGFQFWGRIPAPKREHCVSCKTKRGTKNGPEIGTQNSTSGALCLCSQVRMGALGLARWSSVSGLGGLGPWAR